MRLVIFGLTVSSSWGNGHATLWRGLIKALGARGHEVTFFERDQPFYAAHRDRDWLDGAELILYAEWPPSRAAQRVAAADAAMVTSYCPDAQSATDLLRDGPGLRVFYDLDTPVTLGRLDRGEAVEYLPADGLAAFDLVLSYTGGDALSALQRRLGASRVAPLYGSVDVENYRPGRRDPAFDGVLSHLGTYAADRRVALEQLFVDAARLSPSSRFVLGGSMYPASFAQLPNIVSIPHVWPEQHPDFYASSRFTLNVTRGDMARMGYCPSGRLFEAAACGATIVSDVWTGLDEFFDLSDEIVAVRSVEDVMAALAMPDAQRRAIGAAARERVRAAHTAAHRAAELEALLSDPEAASARAAEPRYDIADGATGAGTVPASEQAAS